MSSLKNIFPNGFRPPVELAPLSPEHQLRVAMSDAGIVPPDDLILDGTLRRFGASGKARDKSGWYVAHDGDVPAGAFGDWKTGQECHWRADIGRELTFQESAKHSKRMAEVKAKREKELADSREYAAHVAAQTWDAAQLASDDHPYIKRKGITNPGWRIAADGRLIAPMLIDGEISGLQYISDDGTKMFLKGSKTGGALWAIGPDYTVGEGRIYLCEGIATAASVFEATGRAVVVSYSAGNMIATAQSVRAKVGPLRDIVIVADNDSSGVGKREADKAAEIVGATVIMPDSGDANDFAQAGGDLAALLEPVEINENYLIHADEFSNQPAPIKWLIKGWLQEYGLSMVHGPSGGGKTFVVLDWCLHIASELPLWADKKVKNGNVVYLAGEGHHGLRGRVAAWKYSHGVNKLNMWLSNAGVDLNTPAGYTKVKKSIDSLSIRPKLIVVDTLHRFLSGDENSAQDAKTMVDACAGLMRDYECSVLLVHHTGLSENSQDRARGSSAWKGALDNEMSIIPSSKDKPMEIASRKSKDAEMPPSIFMQLSSVAIPGWFDEDGEQVTNAIVSICDTPENLDSKSSESKPLSKARQSFEGALLQYGYLDYQGDMYITTDNWAQHEAETNKHIKDTTAKQNVTKTSRYPDYLEGYIKPKGGGYVVCDESKFGGIRALMLKKAKK